MEAISIYMVDIIRLVAHWYHFSFMTKMLVKIDNSTVLKRLGLSSFS